MDFLSVPRYSGLSRRSLAKAGIPVCYKEGDVMEENQH